MNVLEIVWIVYSSAIETLMKDDRNKMKHVYKNALELYELNVEMQLKCFWNKTGIKWNMLRNNCISNALEIVWNIYENLNF